MARDGLKLQTREVAPIPRIQEPSFQTIDSDTQTPPASRSKLRSLFLWRKPSNASLRPNTRAGDEYARQPSKNKDNHLRPALSPRSQSENTQAANANPATTGSERPRPKRRDKIFTDPPPLAQVCRQTILHAMLQSPISYSQKPRSQRPSLSIETEVGQDITEENVEVRRSHKKTESGGSLCSTKSKNFCLVDGSYVLQYDGNSEGDALPEKILVLNSDSVAFACDSVPGRPWVLQITKRSWRSRKAQQQTLRPSWSRLTLRQAEEKRDANILLLVFEDSEELYTWLFAIRKEIEHLGGMAYRPDTEEDDQSWRDDLTRKYASSSSADPDTRKSFMSQILSPVAAPLVSHPPTKITESTDIRPTSTQSSTSSKQTSTSLDRLRDSVTSEGYTSTVATSSADGSAVSNSPICEHFPSIRSVTAKSTGDLSLRAFPANNGSNPRQLRQTTPASSILERRKLSVGSLKFAQAEEPRARKLDLNLPPTISGSPNDIPLSPTRASEQQSEKPMAAGEDNLRSASQSADRSSKRSTTQSNGSKGGPLRKASTAGSANGTPKPLYSLFPSAPSYESKPEPQIETILLKPTERTSISRAAPPPKVEIKPELAIKHRKSRSRTVTLELRQHRFSTLLAAGGGFAMPQRSPAVTDDMIMSNFGVHRKEPPPSPMPEIKVPGLADLNFDLDFLKTPYRSTPSKHSSVSDAKRVSSAKSVSSLRSDGSMSVARTPLGPPPIGPLPAVPPPSGRRQSGNNSISHRSPSRQHDLARRSDNYIDKQATPSLDAQVANPANCDLPTITPRQRHRRTISSSLDGPPPPERSSSRTQDREKSRTRSRSRGYRRPAKQITA